MRLRMARRRGAWLALAAAAGATLWIGAAQGAAGAPLPLGERLTRLQEAARQSREGKDYAGYRARLLELYDLLNGHPDVVYGLARAEAWLGQDRAALGTDSK